ncbi:MAG: T9SS type A sorting domain-containing protein [Ignavibacteriales bacterium]|nr:T9SS type A sorting domain-containing protein [Ignavibacteriales bacterium]
MKKLIILLTLAITLLLMDGINAQDFVTYSPSGEYIQTVYHYSNGAFSGMSYIKYLKKDKGGIGTATLSATNSGYYTSTVETGEILKVTLEIKGKFLWNAAFGNDYTEFQLYLSSSGIIQNFACRVYPAFTPPATWRKFTYDSCTSITIEKWQPTKVEEPELQSSPKSFSLFQNYPNPFNPTTIISYSIVEDSYVKLKVFNLIGEEVKILVDGRQKSGKYSVELTAQNLPSGLYFYRMQAGNSYQAVRKMILLK